MQPVSLEIAKSDPLDMRSREGLLDSGAGQRLQLVLMMAVPNCGMIRRGRGGGGMEIDFCHPMRKVFQEAEDDVRVHATRVIHTKDKVIRTHICAPEAASQEDEPR